MARSFYPWAVGDSSVRNSKRHPIPVAPREFRRSYRVSSRVRVVTDAGVQAGPRHFVGSTTPQTHDPILARPIRRAFRHCGGGFAHQLLRELSKRCRLRARIFEDPDTLWAAHTTSCRRYAAHRSNPRRVARPVERVTLLESPREPTQNESFRSLQVVRLSDSNTGFWRDLGTLAGLESQSLPPG